MLAGELYDPMDPPLVEARHRAQRLYGDYNKTNREDAATGRAILSELFLSLGSDSIIVPPFYCDYGCHIRAGAGVFMNMGCVILDCAWITIGDRVLMGPGVQIYGATHPLDPAIRATGKENAKPVTIGNDVWIGGGAIICPGVTVGDGVTIGAGSVVTRDIPANVLAAGNPCRVIRELAVKKAGAET